MICLLCVKINLSKRSILNDLRNRQWQRAAATAGAMNEQKRRIVRQMTEEIHLNVINVFLIDVECEFNLEFLF